MFDAKVNTIFENGISFTLDYYRNQKKLKNYFQNYFQITKI